MFETKINKIPSSPMGWLTRWFLLGLVLIVTCLLCDVRAAGGGGGGDVDVPKCIENFDIHKDKIIRTTDSRAMGAKYLNEMDLDSRDECLRLCCETENCDVFVYEEKNAGSCYLFQCGPPEDFKCKFTHHVNYTSAINRHLLDLESQIKLTKHEQELTKLRKPEVTNANLMINTGNVETTRRPPSITTAKPTTIVAKNVKTEAPTKIPSLNKKCSSYQFECRSTSECIAIYNACDGIPQCADGSDEAPELQCPDSTTMSQNQPNPQQSQELQPQRLQPLTQPQPLLQSQQQSQSQSSQASSETYRQRPLLPLPLPLKPDAGVDTSNSANSASLGGASVSDTNRPDFLRPVSDPLNPLHGPQYDPQQQMAQYQWNAMPPAQANWGRLQQQAMAAQNHISQYSNKNSHIFNHKENGLQVPDVGGDPSSQMQYPGDGQRLGNYYGVNSDVYGQQSPQLPQLPMLETNWPNGNNQPDFRQNMMYPNQELNPGRDAWNQNIQGPSTKINPKLMYNKQSIKDLPQIIETKEIGKPEQEKIANDLKNSKQHFANSANQNEGTKTSSASPESDQSNDSNQHNANDGHNHGHEHDEHNHEHHAKYITEYKISSDVLTAIEDGIAETPSGAVLSLTLGLILTAMMGILIGCRLRVVRRKMRRGGKSYAHDADYLVNGIVQRLKMSDGRMKL